MMELMEQHLAWQQGQDRKNILRITHDGEELWLHNQPSFPASTI